jgi:hypothetical protein
MSGATYLGAEEMRRAYRLAVEHVAIAPSTLAVTWSCSSKTSSIEGRLDHCFDHGRGRRKKVGALRSQSDRNADL